MQTYYCWTPLDGHVVNTDPPLKDWNEITEYSPEMAVESYVNENGVDMVKYMYAAEVEVDGHGIYEFTAQVSADKVAKKRSE
jgi:hypothetical protein